MASPSESDDLPYLDDQDIQALFKSSSKHLNDQNLKCWEKGINGVSIPLILSMRPYAHILWNHAKKKGHFMKFAICFKNTYGYSTRPYKSVKHVH